MLCSLCAIVGIGQHLSLFDTGNLVTILIRRKTNSSLLPMFTGACLYVHHVKYLRVHIGPIKICN